MPQSFDPDCQSFWIHADTLVDPAEATGDRYNCSLEIEAGVIQQVLSGQETTVSKQQILHAPFVVPGLIDCFAALKNQQFANAYLACGVTSIVGVAGFRRGELAQDAKPAPRIHKLKSVGQYSGDLDRCRRELLDHIDQGAEVVLFMYQIKARVLEELVAICRQKGIASIGEIGACSAEQAWSTGLNALVHTSRYSIDLANPEMRAAVLDEPFSDSLESAKWRWYKALSAMDAHDPRVKQLARQLAGDPAHTQALIPTLALSYLDHKFAANPWQDPVARLIQASDLNSPANHKTGRHRRHTALQKAYEALAQAELKLESVYKSAGAKYLAGSATSVWGTMPGISLHQELDCLTRIGLSPREALAAATTNVSHIFNWPELGQIREGAAADLLLLKDDPRIHTKALRSIEHVVYNGRVSTPDKLIETGLLKNHRSPRKQPDGTLIDCKAMEMADQLFKSIPNATAKKAALKVDEIHYYSQGLRIRAYVVHPKSPGPFPCIIYNRGGNREFGALVPERVWGLLATLASWGYCVIASQYRGGPGSEGQDEFGGADVQDVLSLIPLLDQLPAADASRIGMLGSSRGGLMTLASLCQTDRIRAAVTIGGVTDLRNWQEERPEMIGVYEELIPRFKFHPGTGITQRSPICFASRLPRRVPLLILHGSSDWRVRPAQSLQFSLELLKHRHPHRLVLIEGADHSLLDALEERNTQLQNWFERFVMQDSALPDMEDHGA